LEQGDGGLLRCGGRGNGGPLPALQPWVPPPPWGQGDGDLLCRGDRGDGGLLCRGGRRDGGPFHRATMGSMTPSVVVTDFVLDCPSVLIGAWEEAELLEQFGAAPGLTVLAATGTDAIGTRAASGCTGITGLRDTSSEDCSFILQLHMKFHPSLYASYIKGLVWVMLALYSVIRTYNELPVVWMILPVERGTSNQLKRMCIMLPKLQFQLHTT
ncbi:hypothetical protein EJB05_02613, partial [Eragrostis curvula]